uniref:Nitric oxide synthase 1 adaptor protein n=1 Tax=Chelydra serpentina TaxID=8475 RepID=A0A8C3XNZ4_CHESE
MPPPPHSCQPLPAHCPCATYSSQANRSICTPLSPHATPSSCTSPSARAIPASYTSHSPCATRLPPCPGAPFPCTPTPPLFFSLPVDQSMFENSNTAPTPKLPPSQSVSKASLAPRLEALPATAEPGLRVGSSQHLKNLSKAVGAKVNDFLRRKEPASLGEVGVTEVNASAGAELSGGMARCACRHVLLETFPRLDPPPPAAKKRTPRALKTPLDMLISSQPVVSSLECSAEALPEQGQQHPKQAAQGEQWKVAWDMSQPEGSAELDAPGTAVPNGDGPSHSRVLSVPDLIHEENLEGKLKAADRRAASPPCPEKPTLRLSCLLEYQPPMGDGQPVAQPFGLENEGPHPDLLSFE